LSDGNILQVRSSYVDLVIGQQRSSRELMKIFKHARFFAIITGTVCLCRGGELLAADFSVTTPGNSWTINSVGGSPTLTLERGKTYTFLVNTPGIHPFKILSAGAVNNNISTGTITFTVPMAASNYTYECSVHHFSGTIITVAPAPPPPPTIRILSFSVTTNLFLRSTGTSTWSVIPEFKTNLSSTNWFALTVQSNRYANGTNETFCGKPPANAALIRIKSSPN
jgi:hypothetical protein